MVRSNSFQDDHVLTYRLCFNLLIFMLFYTAAPLSFAVQNVIPFEKYHKKNWSTTSGLPQISAGAIVQDKAGYIWIATEGGLARFDGHRFDVYDGSYSSLFSNPLLRSLHLDKQGTLWIGSSNKLIRYHEQQFDEILYQERSIGSVETFAETGDGQLFIGADRLYRLADNQLILIKEHPGAVTSLYADGDTLWVAGPEAIGTIHNGIYQLTVSFPESGLLVFGMVVAEHGLLLATNRGLLKLTDTAQIEPLLIADTAITEQILLLYQDKNEVLWISTHQALYQIYQDNIVSIIYREDKDAFPWIVSAYESQDGFLWFGSKSHGILRLRKDSTSNYSVPDGLTDPYAWALTEYQQHLLVGFNQGLALFDGHRFTPVGDAKAMSNPVAYSLFVASDHHIWVGTRLGVNRLNDQFEVVQRFPALDHTQVNGITEDRNGIYWFATLDGLYRLDLAESDVPQAVNDILGIPTKRVRAIFMDAEGIVWFGTDKGLFYLQQNVLKQIDDDRLKNSYVSFITSLTDGRLLIGTFQSGLAVLQPDNSWFWLTEQQGLPQNGLFHVEETRHGLVISGFQGVYLLQAESLNGKAVITRILIDDMINETNEDGYRCCNGAGKNKGVIFADQVWFPTLNGIVGIKINELLSYQISPAAVIEGITADNVLYSKSEVILSAAQRDIAFRFTSPVFYRSQALLFRYRLVGYDNKWTETSDRRVAYYTNLPAGKYTFEVQTRYNGEQQWSPAVYQHILLPALWYETGWFKLGILLLILLCIRIVVMYRVKHLAKEQERLEKIVLERTSELEEVNKKLAVMNQQLKKASITDTLTGVHNRRYLEQIIDHLLAKSTRYDRTIQCILIDIDNFKQINDSLGHQVGDDILVKLASLLKSHLRSSDHLIRWGGEEFLIIQENASSAVDFVSRIYSAIATETFPHQNLLPAPVSCSAGIITHPLRKNANWSWDVSLTLADKALYVVKNNGKAGWLSLQLNESAPESFLDTFLTQTPEESILHSGWFSYEASPALSARLKEHFG